MIDVPAFYHARDTNQPHAVRLRWHAFDGVLEIRGEGVMRRVAERDITIEGRYGTAPRMIRFADGTRCEVPANDDADAVVDSWKPQRTGKISRRFAVGWTLAIVSVAAIAVIAWLCIGFGLPWAARRVAFALPTDITRALGDQTLETLDRSRFGPSRLTHARQLELQATFDAFLKKIGNVAPHQIEFRHANDDAPNAFALPSGVVVLTDQLVQLAAHDEEVIAVLAHELGHLEHRHVLRGLLQNSAVFVVIALITGDVSSAATFGGALPAYLLQSRYSREFEREADTHAVSVLQRAKIPPDRLARMLDRLSAQHGESDSSVLGYLRSHPPTPERIRRIRDAEPR